MRDIYWKKKYYPCLDIRQLGTDVSRLNTRQSEIFKGFRRKGSFLRSESFRYLYRIAKRSRKVFWFCSWWVFRACAYKNIALLATLNYLWPDPLVKNAQNQDEISHSYVLGVFKVCLELPSDSKDQFVFVVGEYSELEKVVVDWRTSVQPGRHKHFYLLALYEPPFSMGHAYPLSFVKDILPLKMCSCGSGARFSNVPVTFRARSYILKSKSIVRWRSF